MTRGRKTSLVIRLTPAERRTLLQWQRSTAIPAGVARHSRILLLLADGRSITDIAATVGLRRRHVYTSLQRFRPEGLAGLEGRARRQRGENLGEQDEVEVGARPLWLEWGRAPTKRHGRS